MTVTMRYKLFVQWGFYNAMGAYGARMVQTVREDSMQMGGVGEVWTNQQL